MSGKARVLVTGASAGVGLTLVKRLASLGYQVYGCARNVTKLQELDCPGKENIRAVACDISKESDVKNMFDVINKDWGGLDICVNNAGMAYDDTILDGNPERWRTIYNVNVIGLCMVTQNAVKSMVAGGSDNCIVLNVNSVLGLQRTKFTMRHRSLYIGSKHAITGIAAALRGEICEKGLGDKIRVMQVHPGLIETEMMYRSSGDDTAKQVYGDTVPLTPEVVVDSIVHALQCPKHCTITEQVLHPTAAINEGLDVIKPE